MRISALGTINPDLQRTFRNSRTMVLAQKAYQSERLWKAPATTEKAIEITPSE
jgi:hypothetical protein